MWMNASDNDVKRTNKVELLKFNPVRFSFVILLKYILYKKIRIYFNKLKEITNQKNKEKFNARYSASITINDIINCPSIESNFKRNESNKFLVFLQNLNKKINKKNVDKNKLNIKVSNKNFENDFFHPKLKYKENNKLLDRNNRKMTDIKPTLTNTIGKVPKKHIVEEGPSESSFCYDNSLCEIIDVFIRSPEAFNRNSLKKISSKKEIPFLKNTLFL